MPKKLVARGEPGKVYVYDGDKRIMGPFPTVATATVNAELAPEPKPDIRVHTKPSEPPKSKPEKPRAGYGLGSDAPKPRRTVVTSSVPAEEREDMDTRFSTMGYMLERGVDQEQADEVIRSLIDDQKRYRAQPREVTVQVQDAEVLPSFRPPPPPIPSKDLREEQRRAVIAALRGR